MSEHSSLPQWTPTRNRGLQLDWHEKGVDLEIEFPHGSSDGSAVFSWDAKPSEDWDGPISANTGRLRQIFAEILVPEVNGSTRG
jgi:hypothetical protein